MESKEYREISALLEKAKHWPIERAYALYCTMGSVAEARGHDTHALVVSMSGKPRGFYKCVIRELRQHEPSPGFHDDEIAWCRKNFIDTVTDTL